MRRTASHAPAMPPAVIWVAKPTGFLLPFRDIFVRMDEGGDTEYAGIQDRGIWRGMTEAGRAARAGSSSFFKAPSGKCYHVIKSRNDAYPSVIPFRTEFRYCGPIWIPQASSAQFLVPTEIRKRFVGFINILQGSRSDSMHSRIAV
jgi:hypothetical protein